MNKALATAIFTLSGLILACSRGNADAELTPASAEARGAERLVSAIADARCRQAARCGHEYPELAEAGGGSCMTAMENDTYAELTQCVRPVQQKDAERCLQAIEALDCGRLGALRHLGTIDSCSAERLCGN